MDSTNCFADSIRKPTYKPLGIPCLQIHQFNHEYYQCSMYLTHTPLTLWLAPMCAHPQWWREQDFADGCEHAQKAGPTL